MDPKKINNASFSARIKMPIFLYLYVNDYENAVQKQSFIAFRGVYLMSIFRQTVSVALIPYHIRRLKIRASNKHQF